MSIGKNIQNLRLQRGVSQKELAVIAGVSDKTVSSWETDRANPRMGPIQKMADFFGIRKSDIIEPDIAAVRTDHSRNMIDNAARLSKDEKNLLETYRHLDTLYREILLTISVALLNNQAPNFNSPVIQNNQNGNNFYNPNGDNNLNITT